MWSSSLHQKNWRNRGHPTSEVWETGTPRNVYHFQKSSCFRSRRLPQPHESFPWLSRAFLPSGHPCHFKEGDGYWSLHISQRRALCLICHLCLRMIEFIRFFPESRCEWIRQHMSLGAVRKQARTGWMWGVIKNIFPLIRIPLKIDIPKQWRRKTKYTSWGGKNNKT